MNRIQRNYFWNKKKSKGIILKAWKEVCLPLRSGDLGFKDTNDFNTTLLVKFAWRLLNEVEAPWVQLMEAKYVFQEKRLFGRSTT